MTTVTFADPRQHVSKPAFRATRGVQLRRRIRAVTRRRGQPARPDRRVGRRQLRWRHRHRRPRRPQRRHRAAVAPRARSSAISCSRLASIRPARRSARSVPSTAARARRGVGHAQLVEQMLATRRQRRARDVESARAAAGAQRARAARPSHARRRTADSSVRCTSWPMRRASSSRSSGPIHGSDTLARSVPWRSANRM